MSKLKLVYVLAASHSGSTLTSLLIASHPKLCSVGELKLKIPDHRGGYLCSCRKPLANCDFWHRITRGMRERGFEFDPHDSGMDFGIGCSSYTRRLLRPLHRGALLEGVRDTLLGLSPCWLKHYPQLQKRTAALVDTILSTTGASAVVDSSKTALRLKFLLRNEDLDVCVVRLVRDGRGVALTYMQPSRFADASDPALRGGGTGAQSGQVMSMEQAATLWKRSNDDGDAVAATVPPHRLFELRYEDLCRDPRRAMHAIHTFVGFDPEEWNAHFRDRELHVVGNGMRLDSRSEVELDERWKTVLSDADKAAFDRIAGDLNRGYGYS